MAHQGMVRHSEHLHWEPGELVRQKPEVELPRRDREWWWSWLSENPRDLIRSDYGDQLSLVSDPRQFSVELKNESQSVVLALHEVRHFKQEYGVEIDRSDIVAGLPELVKAELLHRKGAEKLVQKAINQNWTLEQLCRQFVFTSSAEFGFTARYWMPRLESEQEIIERSIAIGAYLLQQIMQQRKWRHDLDALIVTSSVLPADLSVEIIELAREKNILSKKTKVILRDVRTACTGAALAMAIVSEDPQIRELERVAILSLDPLGDMMGFYPAGWRVGREAVVSFGNGFVGVGMNASEVTAVPGSQVHFAPDDMRIIRYYQSPAYAKGVIPSHLTSVIQDPKQMIHSFSLFPNHQAITVELPPPLTEGIPFEPGEHFSYAKWIVMTFPGIFTELLKSIGPELAGATVSSNQSAKGMFQLLRKVYRKNTGSKHTDDSLSDGFEPNQANASTAGQWNIFNKPEVQDAWNAHKRPIIFTATGVGASIALMAFILGKRKE